MIHEQEEVEAMSGGVFLSVIIPAYNEEDRIGETLSRVYDYLRSKDYEYEVIVVDDGSTDNTISVVQRSGLSRGDRLRVIKNGENQGKGFSVRNGIMNSRGEFVLFSDADMSTPIEDIDKLFRDIEGGHDIVIGSRDVKDSRVKVRQPWYRETMGKIFNLMVKLLLLKDFRDTQCGFKLFRGDVARDIAGEMRINGFCFDVEMLFIARIKGCRIKERGVTWENSPLSKVKIMDSSIKMFLDLLRIRSLHG